MKLKSKDGALVTVEFFTDFVSFSLDGYIRDFDGDNLQIAARAFGQIPIGYAVPEITIAAFNVFTFEGDFRDDDQDLFLSLWMTRPFDGCRIHICGEWPETPRITSTHVH
jgi:hypothetical protein